MKKIYVLIGNMEIDEGTEKLKNGEMCYKSEVAYSETEMKEITKWYFYISLKWMEITIKKEGEEIVKTREIYTWGDKNKKIRYSQNPKYAYKKIMEVMYGNLGYDD